MSSKSERLAYGRRVKRATAKTLQDLEDDDISLIFILTADLPYLSRVRLWTVMLRAPHFGEKGAKRVCERAKVWPETRLGDLTTEERDRIVAALPPRAKGG